MRTGLDLAHDKLGWPSREKIVDPPGAGPKVFARLAQKKIQSALRRLPGCESASVGVLTHNPECSATEAPLAIVCELNAQATPAALRTLHRLAWNFSHSPLLITLEPTLVRAWTCCKHPEAPSVSPDHAEIPEAGFEWRGLSAHAARALGWVELLSGDTFRRLDPYFQPAGRVDQLLLSNLTYVRRRLLEEGLPEDVCHDLLARVIFTQFLFDRKDSSGRPALGPAMLGRLAEQGVLHGKQQDLHTILRSRGDSYRLFRWLNERFNGDLFPGKGETAKEREDEWQAEMEQVTPDHLRILADFASGQLDLPTGQRFLWPEYSFDALPLEFISSVYEEFVHHGRREGASDSSEGTETRAETEEAPGTGVHYTPQYLVDFVLDDVLPWEGRDWDVKVLDPACGSGIFLVKAFQRLVHRWKSLHPTEPIGAPVLRRLLTRNLFGVDKDSHAVRVASFSLYLAMCDEIDPRYYWTHAKFPRLRGDRLIESDFFCDAPKGIRTSEDAESYDRVVGNPPWKKGSETPAATTWANRDPANPWPIANRDFGPLFLAKAAALAKRSGLVSMIQPASGLLSNRQTTAMEFRRKLFSEFQVRRVVNLSALRFGLFKEAVSPACVVTLQPVAPNGALVRYICPRPACSSEDDYRLIIEPQCVSDVLPKEAADDPRVWSALMWGGRRDLALTRALRARDTLGKREADDAVVARFGVIWGDEQRQPYPEILDRPLLESDAPLGKCFLRLRAEDLQPNTKGFSQRKTDLGAFDLPQLIVKRSWSQKTQRFRAVLVESRPEVGGVVCTDGYLSVHDASRQAGLLEAACLAYNSRLAVYYLLLNSGRVAGYIPAPNKEALLEVPIPDPRPGLLDGVSTLAEVDGRIRDAFALNDAQWALVDDAFDYTLPDFKGGPDSPGRRKTRLPDGASSEGNDEPVLQPYCEFFLRVLRAGFGTSKDISATIFQQRAGESLPVRLVSIHLGWPGRRGVDVEAVESSELRTRLSSMYSELLRRQSADSGGIAYHRVARIYDVDDLSGRKVPTVFLVKPDQIRYWTRSMALRDADEVAADIMLWREEAAEDAGEC